MKHVICPICGSVCSKYGKTKAGSQRWFCKKCGLAFSPQIDNSAKQLQIFLDWLFSKGSQSDLPGGGRTFRRKTAQFWDIWTLPPVIDVPRDILYVDGIYLGRKACVLICRDEKHVLGWYLCRYENSRAWKALMDRIPEPKVVVSDGGTGFAKALKKTWPHARHQRCLFHVFCQVKRYTTSQPKTLAGIELYALAKDLLQKADRIEDMVLAVERQAPNTVSAYRERLEAKLREVLNDTAVAEERVIAEAAIFADRVATDEETVRLHSHLSQFRKMMAEGSPIGRKLDFLIQEFNREANTIGSKCQDSEIAYLVVDLKSEIEKIREQVQNIE